MGTSWISRKGEILEKGGMIPGTNYGITSNFDVVTSNIHLVF